ncbi:hypothetical protein CXQ85_003158 [Candidozyma haemuli]|uniref:Uncharacterized protein n=1 Tax=Candidozyma haemuli TaxID=45357 RepID=A0A2V1B228_9ASCO|nr:hypothetical protein CXQ85_003158 [[Candida] haemuloni]PVH23421.1 hypothetical protein CXQ85_003158 [[Candida] haemuloni]
MQSSNHLNCGLHSRSSVYHRSHRITNQATKLSPLIGCANNWNAVHVAIDLSSYQSVIVIQRREQSPQSDIIKADNQVPQTRCGDQSQRTTQVSWSHVHLTKSQRCNDCGVEYHDLRLVPFEQKALRI